MLDEFVMMMTRMPSKNYLTGIKNQIREIRDLAGNLEASCGSYFVQNQTAIWQTEARKIKSEAQALAVKLVALRHKLSRFERKMTKYSQRMEAKGEVVLARAKRVRTICNTYIDGITDQIRITWSTQAKAQNSIAKLGQEGRNLKRICKEIINELFDEMIS